MSTTIIKSDQFLRILRAYARRIHVVRAGIRNHIQVACPKSSLKWMLTLPFVPTVHCWSIPGLGSWGKKDDGAKTVIEPQAQTNFNNPVVAEAERLYENNEHNKLYNFLKGHKDSGDADVLWRLARAARDVAKLSNSKETVKELYYEGLTYVTKALEIDNNNFACHKWYAIMLNCTGELEGTKQKIANALTVKEHFLKAAELNPKDATTVHSLGYWYYCFAELKWYERKIANTLYGNLPTGTFEQALEYFLQAEKIDPDFYSMNLVMIGQTYMKLQDAKKAYPYLAKAYHYPIKTTDDKEAHALAEKLLKTLGVKGTPQLEALPTD